MKHVSSLFVFCVCRLFLVLIPNIGTTDAFLATVHQTANHSSSSSQIGGGGSGGSSTPSLSSSRVKATHKKKSHHLLMTTSNHPNTMTTDLGSSTSHTRKRNPQVPKVFFALNSATKWLVTLAVTVGVFWEPKSFRGPYIIVGGIGATVVAKKLKRWINQGRPDGAPFTDPGMPSSHALVSFFMATAWAQHMTNSMGGSLGALSTMSAAFGVSILRVICGYHTAPQIIVGGLVGTIMGYTWMAVGTIFNTRYTKMTFIASWMTYLVGSAIYIQKEMTRWWTDEKHL